MSEIKFDVVLQSWMESAVGRLAGVHIDHPIGRKVLDLGIQLLEEAYSPYTELTQRHRVENEEAMHAAEEVGKAESRVDLSYDQLRSKCWAQYYLAKADSSEDEEVHKKRMDRAFSRGPAEFASLGVARTRAAMQIAVEYAEKMLAADDTALTNARAALDALNDAMQGAELEKGESLAAMQAVFAAREEAKNAYVAARRFVNGALSLGGSDQNISQLMPPVSGIYATTNAPKADEDVLVEA